MHSAGFSLSEEFVTDPGGQPFPKLRCINDRHIHFVGKGTRFYCSSNRRQPSRNVRHKYFQGADEGTAARILRSVAAPGATWYTSEPPLLSQPFKMPPLYFALTGTTSYVQAGCFLFMLFVDCGSLRRNVVTFLLYVTVCNTAVQWCVPMCCFSNLRDGSVAGMKQYSSTLIKYCCCGRVHHEPSQFAGAKYSCPSCERRQIVRASMSSSTSLCNQSTIK